MSLILIALIILLVFYITYLYANEKPSNSPPTIWRLPVWGSYWILLWGNYKFPHRTIQYYIKKYKSKIIGCWLGPSYTVIVNDYPSIKEVLTRKEFDGRPYDFFLPKKRAFGGRFGIFFNEGWEWQDQRRFSLHNLRDFGFGRRHEKLENYLFEELNILLNTIRDGPINDAEKKVIKNDRAFFPTILFPLCANMIWVLMSGKRYDRSQHELLRQVSYSARCFQKGGDTTGGAISITNWLSYFGNLFGFRDFFGGNQGMVDFTEQEIKRIKENDSTENPEGFLALYLQEMKEKFHESEQFSEKQLIMITVDYIFPALTAVPSVITHCIKYLLHYPNIMKRVQSEIDNVIGRERLPQWNDRKILPYTEATIREVLRMETLTPWSIAHKCVKTTTLQNYVIPAETVVITNLAAMHDDKDLWGDPEIFRPERFLNENGQLGKDWSLPFGFGRRVCAGETFARFVFFAVITTLVQQFDMTMIDGQPTSLNDKIPGLIVQPKYTWIRMKNRS